LHLCITARRGCSTISAGRRNERLGRQARGRRGERLFSEKSEEGSEVRQLVRAFSDSVHEKQRGAGSSAMDE